MRNPFFASPHDFNQYDPLRQRVECLEPWILPVRPSFSQAASYSIAEINVWSETYATVLRVLALSFRFRSQDLRRETTVNFESGVSENSKSSSFNVSEKNDVFILQRPSLIFFRALRATLYFPQKSLRTTSRPAGDTEPKAKC